MARRRNIIAPRETLIQEAVIEHWQRLGEPNTLVAAIPNQKAFGQPGLTKGLPDLLVMGPRVPGHCHAGFIELKRDRRSPVSEDQKSFARLCFDLAISIAIAYGRDEPIRVLEDWGVVRRAAA
jgi:hypothetical protein